MSKAAEFNCVYQNKIKGDNWGLSFVKSVYLWAKF